MARNNNKALRFMRRTFEENKWRGTEEGLSEVYWATNRRCGITTGDSAYRHWPPEYDEAWRQLRQEVGGDA